MNAVRTYRVASSRRDTKLQYLVHTYRGRGVCNCQGSHFVCKHVRRALAVEGRENRMTSTALAVREPQSVGLTPIEVSGGGRLVTQPEMQIMTAIAGTVIKAGGMVPAAIKTPEQALAVMLAGHEIGLPPMTALRRLYIVNGRTEIDAQCMMGIVQAADPTARFRFHRYDDDGCDVELFRAGRGSIRVAYTYADAEKSGQAAMKKRRKYAQWKDGKPVGQPTGWEDVPGPWQLYRRDMCAWNAIRRVCKLGAADCLNRIPSRRIGEIIDAVPHWLDDPEARAPGDEGALPPLANALAAGVISNSDDDHTPPRNVDPDTGEIFDEDPPVDGEIVEGTADSIDPEDLPFEADLDAPATDEQRAAIVTAYRDLNPDFTEKQVVLQASSVIRRDWKNFTVRDAMDVLSAVRAKKQEAAST